LIATRALKIGHKVLKIYLLPRKR